MLHFGRRRAETSDPPAEFASPSLSPSTPLSFPLPHHPTTTTPLPGFSKFALLLLTMATKIVRDGTALPAAHDETMLVLVSPKERDGWPS